ncbi:hypothetical protein GYH30_042434 [Glycine max]|nr:hypothetical protein GYH30_042434 [Glycine max]
MLLALDSSGPPQKADVDTNVLFLHIQSGKNMNLEPKQAF